MATDRMPTAADPDLAIDAELAFTRLEDVSLDDRNARRARTLDPDTRADPQAYDRRICRAYDGSAPGGLQPDLREHGFARIDLSARRELQAVFERVRVAGRLGPADVAEIRRNLLGRTFTLPGGERLWLLFIAREGFFMRRAGPNGMALAREPNPEMNEHDAAVAVHADQDVEGTPLRQLMRGAAPWLFRHESPGRRNRLSRLALLNVWIPLQQVTRPLVLMDRRSLDRQRHQLRYGLITDAILPRGEDMRINDIWTFLHDDEQRWHFTSEMDARQAYVFETLGTPHGSFILPGEERAEARYRQLHALIAAARGGDAEAVTRALALADDPRWRAPATASLARAIAAMEQLLAEARADPSALLGGDPSSWCARATEAADRVIRKSLEMRAVALLLPRLWPRPRRG